MENRELDRRCAEIMGWTDFELVTLGGVSKWVGHKPGTAPANREPAPPFETSLDACRELVEWANIHKYGWRIIGGLCPKIGEEVDGEDEWNESNVLKFMLATPRQIAESFVQCFGNSNDNK